MKFSVYFLSILIIVLFSFIVAPNLMAQTVVNFVPNSSVEIPQPGTSSRPQSWYHLHDSRNNTSFSYPVTGYNSTRAIKLKINSYSINEEGWYFSPVNIQPNIQYTYSDYYISTANSYLVVEYFLTNGTYLDTAPVILLPSTIWKQAQLTFTTPANAVNATVIHTLRSTGELTTDVFSLAQANSPTPTLSPSPTPTISATSTPAPTPTATPSPSASPSPTPIPSQNLILNPSFENGTTTPDHWQRDSWGTNNAQFTWGNDAYDGVKSAMVAITNYTNGDAKWNFEDITVVPGQQYAFSDYSKGNTQSVLVAHYAMNDGTDQYFELGRLSPSTTWQKFSTVILPPVNAVSFSVFHLIQSIGTLTVDNYAMTTLSSGPTTDSFGQGYVSLTFDDGLISHYSNALPIINAAGLKGSFYIITGNSLSADHANLIANSNLDTANGGAPQNWSAGSWGTNNAQFSYPVAGAHGNAAQVTITSYTDGDAKWYFNDVPVIANTSYTFADTYKSDATTELVARYKMSDGTLQYVGYTTVPPTSNWKMISLDITPPANAVSMTMFHLIQSVGTLTVDDYYWEKYDSYLNAAQILQFQANGQEVSAHTRTHPSLPTLSTTAAHDEIFGSRADLQNIGVTPVSTFVYPYGDYNDSIIQMVKDAGFIGARSVASGFDTLATNKYTLKAQDVDFNTRVADVQTWIDAAAQNKTWLILMFHQIDNNGDPYSTTPANLQAIANYLKTKGIAVITMSQGLSKMP